MRIPQVAVIGASDADQAVCAMAERVGAAVAAHKCHLVCGGGGGVMEAACRGFRKQRDLLAVPVVVAVGLLPGAHPDEGNDYLDVVLPTGMGLARNALVARCADGVVVVGGCAGTLSELALAWQFGKPVCALTPSGGWARELAGKKVDQRRADQVYGAATPEEAVALVVKQIAR